MDPALRHGELKIFRAWLRKCWIGNLPEGTQWKALQEHMNQAKKAWLQPWHMPGGQDHLGGML